MGRPIGRAASGLRANLAGRVTPEEVQKLRKDLKCSAHELGRALGVDANTILAWESGEEFPTKRYVDHMKKLEAQGPDAIARAPKGRGRPKQGMDRLGDPKLWELVRKLCEHPALFDQVAKLAEAYPDPAER
jgi:transcriptional regulator with XRE-family HTH domain